MKVALLVCDHVRDDLTKVYGDYPFMFGILLRNLKLEPFFVVDGQFPNVEDWDGFVVTGSKRSVYDDEEWIHQLAEFTREAFRLNKKYVGVCFGHQMIGHALGGRVQRADLGYLIGLHRFEFTCQPDWINDSVSAYHVLMLCQDQVTILPENTKLLASSSDCPIGMFTVGDHFLGIQGHPEFSKEYNQAVFESRIELIGQKKVEEAIVSLSHNPDTLLIGSWMELFLSRNR